MKLLLILAISSILGITNVSTEEPQASIEEPPPLEAPIKPVIKEKKKAVSKPAPKPKAVPVVPSAPEITYSVGCEQYRPLIAQYSWDVATMMRICNAESGGNPTNHNWTDNHGSCLGSYGLFQIGCIHGYSVAHLENPANNIAAAYKVWNGGNYQAWSTF